MYRDASISFMLFSSFSIISTACKQICHLKCAIKPEDMPEPDGLVENVNSEINEFGINTDSGNVPKQHSQTRNVARLRKQVRFYLFFV